MQRYTSKTRYAYWAMQCGYHTRTECYTIHRKVCSLECRQIFQLPSIVLIIGRPRLATYLNQASRISRTHIVCASQCDLPVGGFHIIFWYFSFFCLFCAGAEGVAWEGHGRPGKGRRSGRQGGQKTEEERGGQEEEEEIKKKPSLEICFFVWGGAWKSEKKKWPSVTISQGRRRQRRGGKSSAHLSSSSSGSSSRAFEMCWCSVTNKIVEAHAAIRPMASPTIT